MIKQRSWWVGFFDRWVVVGSVISCGVLMTVCGGILLLTRPANGRSQNPTPLMTVIPPLSAAQLITLTPVNDAPLTPTSVPTLVPGKVGLGSYVQISGTDGDGLRLRSEPSLQSLPRLLGRESEVFQVTDGPRDADGHTWWYLVAPYDANRNGWAVVDYLVWIQNP